MANVISESNDTVTARPGDGTAGTSIQQFEFYRTHGFCVVRKVFSSHEMNELRQETERLLTESRELISQLNLRCRYMPHHETDEPLFEVFDPVNDISPVCERFANDPRILGILESIYTEPALLFKEKLIFKPPGAMGYKLHQDIPRYWEGFPRSFVTVLIPIDQTTRENGCTEVFSGYHSSFLSDSPETYMLPDETVDPARRTWLEMEPGDIAIFDGLTPHRSDPNRSPAMRRTFYVSYNAASDGGDQRASHYAEFQQKMRSRVESQTGGKAYFQ